MCEYGIWLQGMLDNPFRTPDSLILKRRYPQFTLRGHTSTVRCLKMSDANTAISGSRDTTLRIWDLKKGICKHILVGHQASVRCLACVPSQGTSARSTRLLSMARRSQQAVWTQVSESGIQMTGKLFVAPSMSFYLRVTANAWRYYRATPRSLDSFKCATISL
jgi:WD40 repeat protein